MGWAFFLRAARHQFNAASEPRACSLWPAFFSSFKMSDSPSASPLLPVVIDDDSDSFVLIGSHDCCGASFNRKFVIVASCGSHVDLIC
jgi:hypothetical protein